MNRAQGGWLHFTGAQLRQFAVSIAMGSMAAIAMLSSSLLDPQPRSRPSENVDISTRGAGPHPRPDGGDGIQALNAAPVATSNAFDSSASSGPAASSFSVPIILGTSPPNFQSAQRAKEAAFAAERLDPEWRNQKFQELSASLAAIAHEVESAQIDCRSSMCRVELVSRKAETLEEQSSRLKVWFEEVKQRGFQRIDSEFLSDGTTSLSYLFTNPVSLTAQLPLEFDPEMIESFAQALRANDHEQRTVPGQTFDPITWTDGTSDPAIR